MRRLLSSLANAISSEWNRLSPTGSGFAFPAIIPLFSLWLAFSSWEEWFFCWHFVVFFLYLAVVFNLRKDDSPLLYLAVDCGISGDWGFSSSHRSSFLPICRSSMPIFIGITNIIIVIIIIALPSQRSPMSIFIATIIGFSSLSAITTSHKVWKLKRRMVIPKVAEIALQFNIPFVESYTSQGKWQPKTIFPPLPPSGHVECAFRNYRMPSNWWHSGSAIWSMNVNNRDLGWNRNSS